MLSSFSRWMISCFPVKVSFGSIILTRDMNPKDSLMFGYFCVVNCDLDVRGFEIGNYFNDYGSGCRRCRQIWRKSNNIPLNHMKILFIFLVMVTMTICLLLAFSSFVFFCCKLWINSICFQFCSLPWFLFELYIMEFNNPNFHFLVILMTCHCHQ